MCRCAFWSKHCGIRDGWTGVASACSSFLVAGWLLWNRGLSWKWRVLCAFSQPQIGRGEL